jgi:hypothetical protein
MRVRAEAARPDPHGRLPRLSCTPTGHAKALPRDDLFNKRKVRLAMGQTTPPPPQVVVVRQGHSGCFWFLIFLLIAVVIVGIVIFLSVMGILGALFG